MIKKRLLFLLLLFIESCRSGPSISGRANPHEMKSWAQCKPNGQGITAVDLYLWNRSPEKLQILTGRLKLEEMEEHETLLPKEGVIYNYKSSKGQQYFKKLKGSVDNSKSALIPVGLNDAVNFEFDVKLDSMKPRQLEVSVELTDSTNENYQVRLPCTR